VLGVLRAKGYGLRVKVRVRAQGVLSTTRFTRNLQAHYIIIDHRSRNVFG
jgi:hypothetical protein